MLSGLTLFSYRVDRLAIKAYYGYTDKGTKERGRQMARKTHLISGGLEVACGNKGFMVQATSIKSEVDCVKCMASIRSFKVEAVAPPIKPLARLVLKTYKANLTTEGVFKAEGVARPLLMALGYTATQTAKLLVTAYKETRGM